MMNIVDLPTIFSTLECLLLWVDTIYIGLNLTELNWPDSK